LTGWLKFSLNASTRLTSGWTNAETLSQRIEETNKKIDVLAEGIHHLGKRKDDIATNPLGE